MAGKDRMLGRDPKMPCLHVGIHSHCSVAPIGPVLPSYRHGCVAGAETLTPPRENLEQEQCEQFSLYSTSNRAILGSGLATAKDNMDRAGSRQGVR